MHIDLSKNHSKVNLTGNYKFLDKVCNFEYSLSIPVKNNNEDLFTKTDETEYFKLQSYNLHAFWMGWICFRGGFEINATAIKDNYWKLVHKRPVWNH